MGRKKFFGRSKEGKNKSKKTNTSQSQASAQPDPGSLDKSSSFNNSDVSPLLVAKAARGSTLSSRAVEDQADGSRDKSDLSNSSGTVFIPIVNDSHHSLNSLLSKASSLKLEQTAGNQTYNENQRSIYQSNYEPSHDTSSDKNNRHVPQSYAAENGDALIDDNQAHLVANEDMAIPAQFINEHLASQELFMGGPLPVRVALDGMFRIAPRDFHACEAAFQILRDSLENEGKNPGEVFYDPEEIFMCIRHVSEHYFLMWTQMKQERDEAAQAEKMEKTLTSKLSVTPDNSSLGGSDSTKKIASSQQLDEMNSHNEKSNDAKEIEYPAMNVNDFNINEEDWDDLEETIWCICELALVCCSVLVRLCVGPAWHMQMKDRRIRIRLARFHKLRRSQSFSSTAMSTGSTVTPARRGHNATRLDSLQEEQASGGTNSSNNGQSSIVSMNASSHQPQQLRFETTFPPIPEFLPASIIHFVASFGDRILPAGKSSDFKVDLYYDGEEITKDEVDADVEIDADSVATDKVDLNKFAKVSRKLVWEEQRWLIRKQRLGEAQRELVTALLIDGLDESHVDDQSIVTASVASGATQSRKKRYEWSIPGIHDAVATMVRGWAQTALEGWPEEVGETSYSMTTESVQIIDENNVRVSWRTIATHGAIDWWHAFQITKTIGDLVSIGWRPPPHGRDGEESILLIMTLAKKAIILSPSDMKAGEDDTRAESREERLAAASSATEAVGALSHIGTRGCLPQATIKPLSRALCYVLSHTDPSISNLLDSLFPVAETASMIEENELHEELNTFIMQRESCLNEIAELLWSMLARSSSMAMTANELLQILDVDLLSKVNTSSTELTNDIFAACGAVRSLGASLWGNPPIAKGIPRLRLLWSQFIEVLAEISSSIHNTSKCQTSPLETSSTASLPMLHNNLNGSTYDSQESIFTTIPLLGDISTHHPTYLVLILEISVAVRRLVEGDISTGIDMLSVHEWEPLMRLLESLLPWLAMENNFNLSQEGCETIESERVVFLIDRIGKEVGAIFHQMKVFLSCKQEGTFLFHRILDESVRNRFYLLFFRMISPILPRDDSIMVSLLIIDSWVCGGAISYSTFEWQRKCSSLLGEAFAIYNNNEAGHQGGYAHSPLIRRASLRALVENEPVGTSLNYLEDNSSMSSMAIDPNIVMRNARSIHAESVCKVMLPFLREVLLNEPPNGLLLPEPHPLHSTPDRDDQELDSHQLLLSAVQIAGDLLRSPNLEIRDRTMMIDLLATFTLDTSLPHNKNPPSNGLLENVLKLNDWGDECQLKLESVRQLGLFLRASFDPLLQAHSCVPHVVKKLVDITRKFYNNDDHQSATLSFQMVSIASLFQLACLRLGHLDKAVITNEHSVMLSLSESVMILMKKIAYCMETIASADNVNDKKVLESYNNYKIEASRMNITSSFLSIAIESLDRDIKREKGATTVIDFGPIVELTKEILSFKFPDRQAMKSTENAPYLKFITADTVCISVELKSLCYEVLLNLITSGLVNNPFQQWCEISSLIKGQPMSLSRCKLLSTYSAFIGQCDYDRSQDDLFQEMLSFCSSRHIPTLHEACRGLTACLSSISLESNCSQKQCRNWHQEACLVILANLQSHVDKMGAARETEDTRIHALLLSTLLHTISTYTPKYHVVSDRTKANIIILCHQICSLQSDSSPQILLLSLQCVATAVSYMGIDELGNLVSVIAKRRPSISHAHEGDKAPENAFDGMIFDLLVQRCLSFSWKGRPGQSDGRDGSLISKISDIEAIARDIEDIESFQADEYTGVSIGAWLCNDLLLVCRVASDNSRHRGWVEIIQRSPSTRVRKLVRLSGSMSLALPHAPSKLWEGVSNMGGDPLGSNSYVDPIGEDDIIFTADPKPIASAKEVMRKHRQIFRQRKKQHSGSNSIHSTSLRNFMGFLPDEMELISEAKRATESRREVPSEIKSTASHPENVSVFRSFLHKALGGKEKHIGEVESVLHELDGSISLLDSVYDLSDEPQTLKWNPMLRRALNVLDRTAFLQTHKIALMFAAGPSSSAGISQRKNESSRASESSQDNWILNVNAISPLFSSFCKGLGTLTNLKHLRIFSGGLDTSDYFSDGEYALCCLENQRTMVLFHSVPLMPPGVTNRKRHVGNDVVHIVFVEDSKVGSNGAGMQIISGEFCFVTIFVTPIRDASIVQVALQLREGLDEKVKQTLKHLVGTTMMPFNASSNFVRQLAIRADLACRSAVQDRLGLFSNWQERLRQIRNLERYAESKPR